MEDIFPGEFVHITAKNNLNGYKSSSHIWTEKGKVISIEAYGGGSFYQENNFVTSTHDMEKIWPKDKELNKYTALFITTVLNLGADKYSYGRIRNLENVKGEKILLPLKNQKIYWEWIENFMKRLWNKSFDWFEAKLESIENKVIWKITKVNEE